MLKVVDMSGELRAAYNKDPALRGANIAEIILYQGIWAIWIHRVAHILWKAKIPFIPRLVSQIARFLTNIEIHPGAKIGNSCFIDHGAGIVIGETAVVGDNVMMYHGVTLGGHGWWADEKGSKRHPTIDNDVTLSVGCTILGPIVVGEHSRIGPYAVVVSDVSPNSTIVAPRGRLIIENGVRVPTHDENDLVPVQWFEHYERGGL